MKATTSADISYNMKFLIMISRFKKKFNLPAQLNVGILYNLEHIFEIIWSDTNRSYKTFLYLECNVSLPRNVWKFHRK